MTSARQIFVGTHGKKLPYDAEVEYIESVGDGAYIDTGLKIDDNAYVLSSEFQLTRAPINAWCTYFGTYTSEAAASTRVINFNTTPGVLLCGYRRQSNGQSGPPNLGTNAYSRIKAVLEYCRIRLYSGDVLISDTTLGAPNGQEDTSTCKLLTYACSRMWYFDVTHDGDPVREMAPVRITNELGQSEGAMYDRVSGQLFRNAGTGAFKFGTDIAGGGYKWLGYSPLRFSRSTRLWKEAA